MRTRRWLAVAAMLSPVEGVAQGPEAFGRCLATIRATPAARRLGPEVWERHMRALEPDPRVIASRDAQPEFRLAPWDYLAVMTDDERIADGQARLQEHATLLAEIERRYGVDPAVVVAIWGIESDYGRGRGGFPVLRSLATLSCSGRRASYFRGELLAALRIVARGDIAPERFTGSWAGAFGHTQFMPGTFEWLAVDFDGDGRRDIMDTVADALASTGHFLQRAGRWQRGGGWGIEVRLPAGFALQGEGRRVRRSFATWRARGVTRVDGSPLVADGRAPTDSAALVAPSGAAGPAFLVWGNWHAVFRYNASEIYTLAILHLADRLRGGAPFVTPWPTDDLGLSRADRRALQQLLAARGHAVGEPTAVLTPAITAAVRREQERLGHAVTGRPGQRLLTALRQAKPPRPDAGQGTADDQGSGAVERRACSRRTPASSRTPM